MSREARLPVVALVLMTAAATASTALILAAAPRPAAACGGFFCNQPQGPDDLPVAQTAENVLFAMDRAPDGRFQLEAHVQIFYTGPADRFSWVVPVDNQPELGVGSNALFNTLLQVTQAQFNLEWRPDIGTCRAGSPLKAGPPTGPGLAVAPPAAPAPLPTGVSVGFRGDVGPYDAAVIRSTNAMDPRPLIDWLNQNGYFVSREAERLIADYVREDKWFVAIRLLSERGVNEIQPLVMRFLGPGPCVPLRLTAIASVRDLRINLWVLAEHRVVPENYFEMEINPARINWFQYGGNYEELVKNAADQAGGNAFITEFAGPTAPFKDQIFQPSRYNLEAIRTAATPPDALDRIGSQGFPRDSTLLGILRNQIPIPESLRAMGIDDRTFYNQIRVYWNQYRAEFKPFNAAALAAELEMKLISPLARAQALFDGHPKLTRLATFISPEEMNVDPTFVINPSLPDIPATRTAFATRLCGNRKFDRCTAPVRLDLPGGQAIWFTPKPQPFCYDAADDFERADLDAMPALHRAWERTSAGEGAARIDKSGAILSAIRTHNAAAMGDGCACGVGGLPRGRSAPALTLLLGLLLLIRRRIATHERKDHRHDR